MKYEIIGTIVLGFLTHNDSYDAILSEGTLELIEGDIVFTSVAGNSFISHTHNHAIQYYLDLGRIKEIK